MEAVLQQENQSASYETTTCAGRVIRRAVLPDDVEEIVGVFSAARAIMRGSGNPDQWKDGYPSAEAVRADAQRGGAFVVEDHGRIVGYFALLPSPEPTYLEICGGAWADDTEPYHVVHRIASLPEAHGVFRSVMDFCFAHDSNIRIDTHRDNHIMQHLIEKHGFCYCGIIHLASGDERLAYQRCDETVL